MFRDAKAVDRQRTASSFDTALSRYAEQSERWFDGSLGSVDARLAHCTRLLHAASATTARFDIADTRRYLEAFESLKADREALQDLRYAMLTGAADRQEVTGPPGWEHEGAKTATTYQVERGKGWSGGHLTDEPEVKDPWLSPRDHHPKVPKTRLKKKQTLARTDRRWVTLEAARFVAANTDSLDDSHELATRAHHHAAVKTSTFTPARSASICEAFVEEVVDLGRQAHRPPTTVVRTAAVSDDFADEMMYLT